MTEYKRKPRVANGITRYSSRRERISELFLTKKLAGAKSYDRIAGYFSSSILEVAGEAIEGVTGTVRIVCNSDVSAEDVKTAAAAEAAQHREWCASRPEEKYAGGKERLEKLYRLLKSGKLVVKVVPNDVFGLIHGKAGVITLSDGSRTSFMGSVNETYAAWKLNYELMWEDNSDEAVAWVQEEFDYFWNHPAACELSQFVVEDINRISKRKVTPVEDWKKNPEPAEVAVESPVYRQEIGLWEHQKAFVETVFNDHKAYGARYVLADQVGLGKTIQLAMSALLMALLGDKPILVLVPKTLIYQWQEEMNTLLSLPSAIWLGKCWQDENGIMYPETNDIRKCPRRIGIVSQGIIVNGREEYRQQLLSESYECVIVDEAHRARRTNLGEGKEDKNPQPNNLMRFLLDISAKTKSMLLATATPVQMYPIEAWDLLYILSQKDDSVLGSQYSKWRKERKRTLDLVTGKDTPVMTEAGLNEQEEWMRDPLPPKRESLQDFGRIRDFLNMKDEDFTVMPESFLRMMDNPPMRDRVRRILRNGFLEHHNPFIRHIVRRTREFLEKNGQLPKIEVILHGEDDKDAIPLYDYLRDAYDLAGEFCESLGKRMQGGGFIKTMLLKRMGSTMLAGKNTAEKMMAWGRGGGSLDLDEDDDDEEVVPVELHGQDLTDDEKSILEKLVQILDRHMEDDPKYERMLQVLVDDGFAERGCIIFSQYYDSINWIAERLSKDENFRDERIGLYAGGNKSGIYEDGIFRRVSKDTLKQMVREHQIRILTGTDAASEGLNLQTLGSLINLDLPWNPTRLEQRKGRIQRIGQINPEVHIYNMRYKDSVEDKVHAILSKRLKEIADMFGQIPDVLSDVWIQVALNNEEEARKIIGNIPKKHPFELRYTEHTTKHIDWETCATVLENTDKMHMLIQGWN